MRFGIVIPLIFSGVKSFGIGLPDGCGLTAVPATGSCSGVKNETPLAATLGMGAVHFAVFSGAGVCDRETVIP